VIHLNVSTLYKVAMKICASIQKFNVYIHNVKVLGHLIYKHDLVLPMNL